MQKISFKMSFSFAALLLALGNQTARRHGQGQLLLRSLHGRMPQIGRTARWMSRLVHQCDAGAAAIRAVQGEVGQRPSALPKS
jgi:hypothetical protein